MKAISKYIIGVMSGTSLDGIDLIYTKISFNKKYSFKILKATTVPYSKEWKKALKNGFHLTGEKLTQLDTDYGFFLGEEILKFIQKNKIEKVDLIASHGHTIFHNPEKKYTLQIGNGPQITSISNIKSITNFRIQDVALGGQGAPLVPIGDLFLFSDYDYCLNLGGFSNISTQQNNQRIAFDICPVNIVLNHYATFLNLEFDNEGRIASSGKIHQELLEALNSLSFYTLKKPKSLGFEFVETFIFPLINSFHLEIKDILRTFIEHIAIQITNKIESNRNKTIFITGGGALNTFLIERIQLLTDSKIKIPNLTIVNYKEALVFALLGFLRDENNINCLKSVTGANTNHSSGIINLPQQA